MVLVKIIGVLLIIAIIALAAVYYFNPFGVKNILDLINPIQSTVPVSQIINGSLGNIRGVSNYSSQYKVAVNITKKYNEPIKHLVPFTGNSSSMHTELINQYFFSTQGTSDNMIDYHGLYVPIYENISDVYVNNSSYFSSLIGKVVYIEFNASYDNNSIIQVPYTVQSEKIINSSVAGPMVYWHLTQDTGISNSTAISILKANNSVFNHAVSYIIGIYYNGTEILFPRG